MKKLAKVVLGLLVLLLLLKRGNIHGLAKIVVFVDIGRFWNGCAFRAGFEFAA